MTGFFLCASAELVCNCCCCLFNFLFVLSQSKCSSLIFPVQRTELWCRLEVRVVSVSLVPNFCFTESIKKGLRIIFYLFTFAEFDEQLQKVSG